MKRRPSHDGRRVRFSAAENREVRLDAVHRREGAEPLDCRRRRRTAAASAPRALMAATKCGRPADGESLTAAPMARSGAKQCRAEAATIERNSRRR
jgi:hypothetical protein